MVRITILIVDPVDATLIPSRRNVHAGPRVSVIYKTLTFIKPKHESGDPSDRFEHPNRFVSGRCTRTEAFDNGRLQTVEAVVRIRTSEVKTL